MLRYIRRSFFAFGLGLCCSVVRAVVASTKELGAMCECRGRGSLHIPLLSMFICRSFLPELGVFQCVPDGRLGTIVLGLLVKC